MAFEKKTAAAFGMDNETWARHSNPWSEPRGPLYLLWDEENTYPVSVR